MRVLVAEHSKDVRKEWMTALGAAGFETAAVDNGGDLLKVVRLTQPPFVIVMDLGMRGVSGAAILAELRRIGAAEHLPLIVVGNRRPFVGHSAVRFLSRPVTGDTIVEEVLGLKERAQTGLDWQHLLRELTVQVAGRASVVERVRGVES